jgi:hypothetical protein
VGNRNAIRAGVCAAALAGLSLSVNAQTYQVGQYLGNMSDINRLTYNTMGSAAQHANYSGAGANWTTLASQNSIRMAGTASATIGGRTVPLTLISRMPIPTVATAVRAVGLANPATAAVTLSATAVIRPLQSRRNPATGRSGLAPPSRHIPASRESA